MRSHSITMLGTGLIGDFYTRTLHAQRSRDRVDVIYSRQASRAEDFSRRWGVPHALTDMAAAIAHPQTDVVVIALPNHLHEEAVALAARAGKAVLCTKPLGPDVHPDSFPVTRHGSRVPARDPGAVGALRAADAV